MKALCPGHDTRRALLNWEHNTRKVVTTPTVSKLHVVTSRVPVRSFGDRNPVTIVVTWRPKKSLLVQRTNVGRAE